MMDIRDQFDVALKALCKMGEIAQAKDEVFRLRRQNAEIQSTCGGCYWWMKIECPKEPKIKPSCNYPKCNSFKLDIMDAKLIEKNNARIEEIIKQLNQKCQSL